MKVFIYQDRTWEEFGATRFEVATEIVKPESMHKHDIDIDEDLIHKAWGFPTEEKARVYAKKVLARDDLAFGAVTVQKQVVDWFVEEDRMAEWADVGESMEYTASDFEETTT